MWQAPQKEYLIETILLDLPVPEIYVVNRITPAGESTYVVVDGQQRLRAILEFVTEEFIIRTPNRLFPDIKKFSDLSPEARQRFWRYPVVVRDLEDSTDDRVRDLFQRLNKFAFVLNDQELRNARFKGHFLRTVQQLGEHSFWPTSGLFSSNDIRRMLDLEYISILLCTLIGGIFHRRERLDEFYVMYENEFEEANFYVERFQHTLETINVILPEVRKTRWSNKGDFFTLFVCCDQLRLSEAGKEVLPRLQEVLLTFAEQVEMAKIEPEKATEKTLEYSEAATYATNDKDTRIRRHRVLSEYLRGPLKA